MKRYLSIWLPEWPLTRLRRACRGRKTFSPKQTGNGAPRSRPAFILTEVGLHGLRVAAANASAKAHGVTVGLRFTDAKARCPDLTHEEIDRSADAKALEKLAHWLIRFAPYVSLDGRDGLMLEIGGCAHLYGGEAGLLSTLSRLLGRDTIAHQVALAGTPGAASALARSGSGVILPTGEEKSGLSDLPVMALRLSEEAETLLRRFGLTRIGQLYGIDRKALARRFRSAQFCDAVLLRLDQALGERAEALIPLRPPPAHTARLNCPEPIQTIEAIKIGLEQLAEELCQTLSTRGEGARAFCLLAFRADGTLDMTTITLARPARNPVHILRLFTEKLDKINPGFGIDLLLLEARRTGAMETSAVALSGDLAASDTDAAALAALVDRITAKLGENAVTMTDFEESHLPERAEQHVAFHVRAKTPEQRPSRSPRPIRFLTPPERIEVLAQVPDGPPKRFVWRRLARKVIKADGPERISPEWWRHSAPPSLAKVDAKTQRKWLAPKLDPRADAGLIVAITSDLKQPEEDSQPVKTLPRTRDYYRIEDEQGRRYWVFRKGLYGDNRGLAPDWYVHGMFA